MKSVPCWQQLWELRGESRDRSRVLFFPKENPGARAHLVEKIIIVGPLGSEAFEKNPAESHSEHV